MGKYKHLSEYSPQHSLVSLNLVLHVSLLAPCYNRNTTKFDYKSDNLSRLYYNMSSLQKTKLEASVGAAQTIYVLSSGVSFVLIEHYAKNLFHLSNVIGH